MIMSHNYLYDRTNALNVRTETVTLTDTYGFIPRALRPAELH